MKSILWLPYRWSTVDSTIPHPDLKGLALSWGGQSSSVGASTAPQPQGGLHSVLVHHPLDVMFAILSNSFTLESSVLAKSCSASEKSEGEPVLCGEDTWGGVHRGVASP